MEHGRGRLIDLIDYVEAIERERLKTVLDTRDHKGFFYAEAEVHDGLTCLTLRPMVVRKEVLHAWCAQH